ncbi:MAG: hypothetical protein CME68_09020 [Halobacteriovoraceae bacterium]|nr:hypothetical protein [Halobacteriovoraceae bacterium]
MINVLMRNFLFLGLIIFITACGKNYKQHGSSKRLGMTKGLTIIRENNFIKVPENPDLYTNLLPSKTLNAIGRMELGCTVTHIGGNYAITAGHCFSNPYLREDKASFFVKDVSCNYLSGLPLSAYNVSFGVRGNSLGNVKGNCERIIIAENGPQLDFAIIKLSKAPVEAIFLKEKSKAILGNKVTIYSHPSRRALEWSQDCYLLERRRDGLNRIQYDCDTEGGSSGAAVLDTETLDIVAIHTNGTPDRYYGHNSGQPIQDIINKLKLELGI